MFNIFYAVSVISLALWHNPSHPYITQNYNNNKKQKKTMINQQQSTLSPHFFQKMLQAEHNYNKNPDEHSMQTLMMYYCDCIHYFEQKQQSISSYFKLKIKELIKDIKQFGSAQHATQNKQKMNKNVIRVMQEENIQEEIKKSDEREKRVQEVILKIMEGQAETLQRRKLKRSMNKCRSVATMSFGSVDTSPEVKGMDRNYIDSLKQYFGENMQLNFDEDV